MDNNQEQPDYLNITNTSSLPELYDLQSHFQNDMNEDDDDEHDIPVIITTRSDSQTKKKKFSNPCLTKISTNQGLAIMDSTINVALANTWSLFPKISSAIENFKTLQLDMLIITETWETKSDEEKSTLEHIENTEKIRWIGKLRSIGKKSAGGLGSFFRSERFTVEEVKYQPSINMEFGIFLLTPKFPCAFSKYIIIPFYFADYATKGQIQKGISLLQSQLVYITNKYGNNNPIILGGDANKVAPDEILTCHPDIVQMNFLPTRKRKILDHFFTNHDFAYKTAQICPEIGIE
jgi:hypothetical protein